MSEERQTPQGQVINLPEEGTGLVKCVQLELNGEPILIFANSGQEYHGEILGDFLLQRGIDFDTIPGKDTAAVPALTGDGYTMVGAGYGKVSRGTLRLAGESFDYDLPVNAEHAESLRDGLPGLEIKVIEDI